MKKKLLLLTVASLAVVGASLPLIFSVSEQPELTTITSEHTSQELRCYHSERRQPIDHKGQISLLVWNIYKQNRENWRSELSALSESAQLVLLQEARMSDGLKAWIEAEHWNGNQVNAFRAFQESSGVLNLAKQLPILACAYVEKEPWLQLPKSGLYATYALSNGQTLAVVNLHAVNFTVGVTEYQQQLSVLAAELNQHQGPMIIAGDFNSWSEERVATMKASLAKLNVVEVAFNPDHRTQFINGLPLDHVFYRGLALEKAKAPETSASDHNPLWLRFRLLSSPADEQPSRPE